jgi:glycerol dehydrogenase-like iron-containing ADH family enzyme
LISVTTGSLAAVRGPVLLLADNRAIAAGATRWAEAFAAAGLMHRVRLVDRESDLAAVLAEASCLGAATILAVGIGCPLSVGRAAAEQLGLPLVPSDS